MKANRKFKNGFTLVELLAVIVILAVILAIAIPSISNVMNSSTQSAFEIDSKLLLKTINYKMIEDTSFDPATIDITTLKTVIGLQNNNYDTVTLKNIDGETKIFIKGKNKWDGLYACGTYGNMSVSKDSTCDGFSSEIIETVAACFTFNSGTNAITGYSTTTECPSDVVIPSKIGGVDVVIIGEYAFSYYDLTSVTIPSSVTSIEDWAFSDNNLTSVTIPNSVTSIGEYAFGWNNLTSVTIPSGVTSIGEFAFYGNQLTNVTIPSSVISIGSGVFNNNQLPDNQAFIYKRNSNGTEDKTTLISYGGTKRDNVIIPSSVINIGAGTFENIKLTSVTIPSSVTSIGGRAFYRNNLTNITIPSSVTSIGDFAFRNNQLTNVTIPGSVASIGSGTFNNNQLPDNQAFIYKRNSNGTEDKTTLISYGGAKRDNVIVPSNIISIGDLALSGIQLTSVTIPSSVTSIGTLAFSSNQLTNITIPSSVISIGSGTFLNNNLTSVTIQGSNPQRFNSTWTSIGFPSKLMP